VGACCCAFLTAVIGSLFYFKGNIARAICSQLYTQADSNLENGRSEEAISQFRQILFVSQFLPDKDMEKLHALRSLSALLNDRKEFNAAKSIQEQVNKLIGTAATDEVLSVKILQIKKAFESNKLDEAEKLCKQALEQAAKNPGKHSMAYSEFLDWMGSINSKKGAYLQAADCYRESLELAQDLLDSKDLHRAQIMEQLSSAFRSAGNPEQADKFAMLAAALRNPNSISTAPPTPITGSRSVSTQHPTNAIPAHISSSSSIRATVSATTATPRPAQTSPAAEASAHASKPVEAARVNVPLKPLSKERPTSKPVSSSSNNSETWSALEKLSASRARAQQAASSAQAAAKAKKTNAESKSSTAAKGGSGWGELEHLRTTK
jgi:hypothetical protein